MIPVYGSFSYLSPHPRAPPTIFLGKWLEGQCSGITLFMFIGEMNGGPTVPFFTAFDLYVQIVRKRVESRLVEVVLHTNGNHIFYVIYIYFRTMFYELLSLL
jgi:hypothetical protein